MASRFDGFAVHPLDLFPSTHQIGNYGNNSTAYLDGFNVHPIDSFINNKNNPYQYLGNNITYNYNGFNVQNNITNLVQNTQEIKPNLYSPYSTTSYEPDSTPTNTYQQSNFNTSTIYSQNVGIQSNNYNNFNTIQSNGFSYQQYPSTTTNVYTGTKTLNYDYLQPLNSTIKYPISTTTVTNIGGNYNNTFQSSITYPSYESTNNNISYNLFPKTNINNDILINNYNPTSTITSTNIFSNDLKSTIMPYSNTQTINLDTYTTPTITNITSSITQPNSLYNINKVNTYTNKTYTPISSIQKIQTYGPTINSNAILNPSPSYNIRTYTLPSSTTVQIPTTTSVIVPKKKTIVIPQSNQIVIPKYQRPRTPILSNNIVKYNAATITPIKVVRPNNIIKINNVVPKPSVVNIIPARTNPIVQTPNITINKIKPIFNYNATLTPNVQNHFRSNTISNFGNRTYRARNFKFH